MTRSSGLVEETVKHLVRSLEFASKDVPCIQQPRKNSQLVQLLQFQGSLSCLKQDPVPISFKSEPPKTINVRKAWKEEAMEFGPVLHGVTFENSS